MSGYFQGLEANHLNIKSLNLCEATKFLVHTENAIMPV